MKNSRRFGKDRLRGMGFFDKLIKGAADAAGVNNDMIIGAPVNGECVPIQEVSDPTFGDEILGKGVAIKPTDGKIVAPADGIISTIFPTGHAVAVTTEKGTEILIHVGLDTVKLNGEHFTKCVEDGQKVKKGDLLLDVDIEKIKEAGYDIITPVVICNTDAYKEVTGSTGKVAQGDTILTVKA